ncbi:MAG TPA: CDGSH iron-sulfur domain-containing protein [Nitrospirae bacterium]|nr:CDGSH iron-sulfur domain-containing protein [Nitrospirota bacterium]
MSEPKIADKKPAVMNLEPGVYHWCSCGKSQEMAFCDGSHKGTDFTPLEFKIESKKEVAICNCKHTKTPPYCDGSHTSL